MRERTFKGKRKDNGEWVEGGSIVKLIVGNGEVEYFMPQVGENNTATLDIQDNIIGFENCNFYAVIPESIRDYAGLTDKNGKKIFEGDIVKNQYEKNKFQCVKVFYSDRTHCWLVENKYGMLGQLCNVIGDIEVIGNIYDNPELLK